MRARARAGYTLVELMMIVMIIGVSVLMFTPSFGKAMADRKVSLAARELIRIGRRARADTFGYLRAHVLWIDNANRRVQLLRGPTNSCTLANWADVYSDCPTTATGVSQTRCVESLYLSKLSGATRTITMYEETIVGGTTTNSNSGGRALCFQPSGVVMYGSGTTLANATAWAGNTNTTGSGGINGGFVFGLLAGSNLPNSGDQSQRLHRVLFPIGGSPRSIR